MSFDLGSALSLVRMQHLLLLLYFSHLHYYLESLKITVEGMDTVLYVFRAMELGRECLTLWGYERVDEIIWVKTNQLQRIIRTGRTGHWLNHGKEHCLVRQSCYW